MEGKGKSFSKKRDLSGQSQDDDEKKKLREGSSSSYNDGTILLNCLKYLEVKVKETYDIPKTTNESQIKGEQQLKSLTESNDEFMMSLRMIVRRKKREKLFRGESSRFN